MNRLRTVSLGTCVLLSSVLSGCPEPTPAPSPGPCDSTLLTNTVPLGEEFAALSDVDEVQYRADVNESAMEVELLNAAGETLGIVTDTQMIDNERFEVGTYVQSHEGLSFISRGKSITANQHEVTFELRREEAPSLFVHARFRNGRCAPPSERALHVCAPQLLGDDARLLPSCGLDIDSRLATGERPLLTRLRLEAAGLIEGRDGTRVSETETTSFFDMVQDEALRERGAIDAFLDNSGFEALVASDAHQRLLSIAADPSWSRVLTQHFASCLQDGFDEGASTNENESGLTTRPNRRQSAIASGNNGNRSAPDFTEAQKFFGFSKGDPHLGTFDGLHYDFQAAGDFVAAKRRGVIPFELQLRFSPLAADPEHLICTRVTWTTAAALELPEGRVLDIAINNESGRFEVKENGSLIDAEFRINNGEVAHSSRSLNVLLEDNTEIIINQNGRSLDIKVDLPEQRNPNDIYEGLLGNADGIVENDHIGLDDVVIVPPASTEALRESLRPRWAVNEDNSLFDYAPGTGPGDFEDTRRPEAVTLVGDIPISDRADLQALCIEMGTEPAFLANCMLDIFCAPVGSDGAEADTGDGASTPNAQSRPSGVLLKGAVHIEAYAPTTDFTEVADAETCGVRSQTFHAALFEEGRHTLTAALSVDERPGESEQVTLPSGRVVDSFVLALRPHLEDSQRVQGRLRFAEEVLGFVQTQVAFDESHSIFLDDDVSIIGQSPGLQNEDVLTLGDDGHTIDFDFGTTSEPLFFRVLVEGGAS